MKRFLPLAFVTAALPCAAQEASPRPWELRLEGQRENLDRGKPDWREELLQLAFKPRQDLAAVAGARETERFDQRDREGYGAAYLPLGERRVLHLEGSYSNTHRVLPRGMALAELSWPFGAGWVASAAGKVSGYATGGRVRMAYATLEKYLGDFRLGYTAYLSRPEHAGWAPAHRLAASWYRGELTFLTLSGWRGREVENVFPATLLVTDVRGAALQGGLALGAGWGLTFELEDVRQGDLYTRRGVRLGTRFLF